MRLVSLLGNDWYLVVRSWAAAALALHHQRIVNLVDNIVNVQLPHLIDAGVDLALPPLVVGLSPALMSTSLVVISARRLHHLHAVVALALPLMTVGLSPG